MSLPLAFAAKPRLRALLDHFATIEDRESLGGWRIHCRKCCFWWCAGRWRTATTMKGLPPGARRICRSCGVTCPIITGVPGGRWLTLLMNRIDPALFSAAFTAWTKQTWPERPDLVAIDGKTSRRSHDRATGAPPLHLISAFATTSRLVLGQEAVEAKTNETGAIPILLQRLAERGSLKGALVTIDAIAPPGEIISRVFT